ncbi:unnamed protein product [Brachionus calyciflorus]|uniref:Uncharacterized protein n=1 Tax=Brachionus calyciflorus TaxID=104777 RepID=A0A813P319_9BILA|nr:unnamed protein product [Brachionus calyciflorus]
MEIIFKFGNEQIREQVDVDIPIIKVYELASYHFDMPIANVGLYLNGNFLNSNLSYDIKDGSVIEVQMDR